jgi:hypothetical protein
VEVAVLEAWMISMWLCTTLILLIIFNVVFGRWRKTKIFHIAVVKKSVTSFCYDRHLPTLIIRGKDFRDGR